MRSSRLCSSRPSPSWVVWPPAHLRKGNAGSSRSNGMALPERPSRGWSVRQPAVASSGMTATLASASAPFLHGDDPTQAETGVASILPASAARPGDSRSSTGTARPHRLPLRPRGIAETCLQEAGMFIPGRRARLSRASFRSGPSSSSGINTTPTNRSPRMAAGDRPQQPVSTDPPPLASIRRRRSAAG